MVTAVNPPALEELDGDPEPVLPDPELVLPDPELVLPEPLDVEAAVDAVLVV